jgi:hypothetical protein
VPRGVDRRRVGRKELIPALEQVVRASCASSPSAMIRRQASMVSTYTWRNLRSM